MLKNGNWSDALSLSECLSGLKHGSLCKLDRGKQSHFGRLVPIARFGNKQEEGELVLNRWLLRSLRSKTKSRKKRWRRTGWSLDQVEKRLLSQLPGITQGGVFHQWREKNGMLYAVLNYETALTYAYIDSLNRALINPVERTITVETDLSLGEDAHGDSSSSARTVADLWFSLGLIDQHAAPTKRGILFSFFNYGEGLAIAAALEDRSYSIEDIIHDLANLRAGGTVQGGSTLTQCNPGYSSWLPD